jgi:alkaline phosphatase D
MSAATRILIAIYFFVLIAPALNAQEQPMPGVPWHAQGEKAGDPTQDSVILLTRLTAVEKGEIGSDVPGMDGWVRFEISEHADFRDPNRTPWRKASAEAVEFPGMDRLVARTFKGLLSDHTVKETVTGLKPGTHYYYRVLIRDVDRKQERIGPPRRFKTAYSPDKMKDVSFIVVTGQGYGSRDNDEGHLAYHSMEKLGLDFIVMTGDTVYYDGAAGVLPKNIARATSRGCPPGLGGRAWVVKQMRPHWHAAYALPIQREFFGRYAGYWEVDDHDVGTHDNSWGNPAGNYTFREQNPVPDVTSRTVRWGKALQIWLIEDRQFRQKEPPLIWGEKQMAWMIKSISESDALFKVMINPTAVAGSGDDLKDPQGDCHAERPFLAERKAFFDALKAKNVKNFFLAVGDDHWKYHSRAKGYGVDEFCSGALSGAHHGGGGGRWEVTHDPAGLVDFLHPKKDEGGKGKKGEPGPGGFLRIAVKAEGKFAAKPEIVFQLCDSNGDIPYTYKATPVK